jgi:hypothetical protein
VSQEEPKRVPARSVPLPLKTAPHHGARVLRVVSNLRHGYGFGFGLGWSPGYESLPVRTLRTIFFGAPKLLGAFWNMAVWVIEIALWNAWFVSATGAAPIDNLFGAALFLLGISAFGRLIGPACLVFALYLVFAGGQAHWLDMSMGLGPLAAYGVFCYVFGGDDDEEEQKTSPSLAGAS